MQQVDGALLLLERSEEGLEALVLCEAFVVQATPLEMEWAGPHPLQLVRMVWFVVVGEYSGSKVRLGFVLATISLSKALRWVALKMTKAVN